ncbi:MAG TPA: class I SAM-dependent methyltransferase [Tepidisphaeraceae bacterium]|jgi:SAM-dependent methyltransferase
MPETTPITCPLCHASSTPCFMAGGYRMYRCSACRAAFVHPMPDDAALKRFYDDFHRSANQGGWYDEIEDRMREDFPAKVALAQRAMGRAGASGRLIDVGCGKGFFVKACADAGIDAIGVDLSETGVNFAKEQLKVNALHGSLHDLKPTLGTFDVATFWATIEHLADPVGMLRDIFDILKPGGRLLCDTGIGDDWLDRLLPGVAQWYDPPQHLFVFSRGGMMRAMEAAGFSVAHLDPAFDRTPARRIIRKLRNGTLAAGLRISAAAGRMKPGEFPFTRYPLGNLMTVEAIKP